ncbi:FMN-binding protein [Arenibacter sp. F20364]|uniref:FMN-binding protein n=1 Tax=Arenibacter sp. F20364 TaxID=2926415 RepID=UPI001FF3F66B|nr:FMN-binding protein [Arenibacter sp. F20364]MCK0190777.1 FMN-binding protein [Arenibacter sp. F20364]
MNYRKRKTVLIMVFSLVILGFGIPKNVQKKMDKELEKVFETENHSLQSFSVSKTVNELLPTKITADNFFKIMQGSTLLGYAFVDQAPSKTAKFDYLVIFNPKLEIIHSKVLIYREEYGGEIGSKRWLEQFTGKSGKDRVSHESNIDGISGATISVRSMTNSMDSLLQTIGILQEKKVL